MTYLIPIFLDTYNCATRFRPSSEGILLVLESGDLESLARSEPLPKEVSSLYKDLFPETTGLLSPCRRAWDSVTAGLDRDDWDDVWGAAFQALVSTRDRLIHYKFLHRAYLTPARLARMFRGQGSACWRCSAPTADFMHIFWQ